ncbi:hypothetical protein E1212_17605 [Jiangella ureilytica]|uniref:Helix-hairpin-helix domain-containing protein n=1 Tax=Jiangella ureilytica TaxID=2530374 RepID=A0A4R4RM83_9ACTN|nr:hypothetical protein [Jiangella ureilytica]TDC49623.1 hypothetical protein E1212_17605 [Jiangella ureilytica]
MTGQDSVGERLARGIGQTLWVLIPLLSVTVLAWLPAGQAWWRTRSAGWFITGLVLLLGSAGVIVLMSRDDGGGAAGGLVIIGALVGGIVAALKARPVVFRRRREEVVELPPYPAAAAAVAHLDEHPAVREVLADRERRRQARDLIARDPAMAMELNLGRPDLPDIVDDGDLVDLNNTSAGGLAAALRWDPATAEAFVVARDLRGGYASLDEIAALSGLEPQLLERDAERIVVLPYRPA